MSGPSLTALLRQIKQTLCVPAAEYVPAMGDAMLLLDKAIQLSYQTDPRWEPAARKRHASLVDALLAIEPADRCCGKPQLVWAGNPPEPSHDECCGNPEYDFEGAFKAMKALLRGETPGVTADAPAPDFVRGE